MNWEHLKTFDALAETGSLSRTARRLGLSPATVSRHISALEAEVGTALFDRLPDGYVLTSAGQQFVPLARDMAETAARIDRRCAALDDRAGGVVRIAAGNWASRFLLQRLGRASEKLGRIEVEVVNSYDFASLARRDADIAIRNRRPDSGRLALRRLAALQSAIYGHRDYIRQNPQARGDRRYEQCRWVGFDERLAHLPSARWLAARRPAPPQIRCLQAINILDAVVGAAGLGLLPCFVGEAEPDLERIGAPFLLDGSETWLIIHEDLRQRPAIRHVCDWVVESFAADPWAVPP